MRQGEGWRAVLSADELCLAAAVRALRGAMQDAGRLAHQMRCRYVSAGAAANLLPGLQSRSSNRWLSHLRQGPAVGTRWCWATPRLTGQHAYQ